MYWQNQYAFKPPVTATSADVFYLTAVKCQTWATALNKFLYYMTYRCMTTVLVLFLVKELNVKFSVAVSLSSTHTDGTHIFSGHKHRGTWGYFLQVQLRLLTVSCVNYSPVVMLMYGLRLRHEVLWSKDGPQAVRQKQTPTHRPV